MARLKHSVFVHIANFHVENLIRMARTNALQGFVYIRVIRVKKIQHQWPD
jgi:hypothetical protein